MNCERDDKPATAMTFDLWQPGTPPSGTHVQRWLCALHRDLVLQAAKEDVSTVRDYLRGMSDGDCRRVEDAIFKQQRVGPSGKPLVAKVEAAYLAAGLWDDELRAPADQLRWAAYQQAR